ncbi:MAG TPA: nitrate- and nitrite sensing domain-containing protein, partial [Trebonia sp.]|nr:nitrate- and nitrite sensing domain-containing protein [Trebonia sp.]
MTTFRRRVQSRPIRLFLIGMLAVPLVSLLALWGFAASSTVSAALTDADYSSNTTATNAGVYLLIAELPQERQDTYLWLLSGRRTSRAPLLSARALVDKALPPAKAALLAGGTNSPVLSALITDLGGIDALRRSVDSGAVTPSAAFQAYSGVIDAEFHYFLTDAHQRGSTSLVAISVGAVDGAYALEMAGREAAVINGALSSGGQLTPAIRQLFAASAAERHELLAETQALVTPGLYANYVNDTPAYRQFQAMETQILASAGGRVPVSATAWNSATGAYLAATQKTEAANATTLSSMSGSQSDGQVTEAVIVGGIGLAAVAASVFLLTWFGRKVTKDLTRLNASVRDMAEERLPRVVGLLRRGEDVDVLAESPPPDKSSISEVSTIAESFATVQGAAVAAAVDQARLRKGVNQVFLNISMRNQSLLYRQLKMLDSMERKTSDPGALAELFRLDHLTTRMRRHAEGLIILSGSTPDRGRREPVPVIDVLRAAVAEVEDYVRVDVVSESRDLVVGSAVSDMIHLLAELVENAAVFSPPNTRIEVRADRVGTGLVAEIDDRGLGLSDADRDAVNRRLASPPEFDLANSDQLGLFIVSQLATRHRVMVSLRESAYGGTTAIVRLPFGVVVRDDDVTPVAEDGWVIPDSPAGGPEPHVAELEHSRPADTAARAHSSRQPDAGAPSSFVGTGRHRLRTAPTGRIADAGGDPGRAEPENVPAPRIAPRAPWEMASRAPAPASPGRHLGMPVRVPQASMAPQLRARDQTDWGQGGREETSVDDRAPEATRDMLAQMQQ